jgi:hypothetical protein
MAIVEAANVGASVGFASKIVNDTQARSASERETWTSRRSPYRLRFRLVF